MVDRFLSFLGIAWRAQALLAGEYPVLKAIRANKGQLLILAADVSANTSDRLLRAAKHRGLRHITLRTKTELGQAIGQSNRAAILVLEVGFAAKLEELAGE